MASLGKVLFLKVVKTCTMIVQCTWNSKDQRFGKRMNYKNHKTL